MSAGTFKLAIVVSHPIQHFVPFYRRLAMEPGLRPKVFYMSNFSVRGYRDQEMGAEVAWKMDLLSGYDHEFLPEAQRINRSTPLTLDNPSITGRLDQFDPDAVLTYGYNQGTQMRVLLWCRRHRKPLMMIGDSELKRSRSVWRHMLKSAILPFFLRQYDAFLTTGDNNEDYLRAYGVPQDRLFRSPFTIDEDTYHDARRRRSALRRAFREEHGIGEDEYVVLTVGKLSPRKRPMDAVDAARAFADLQSGPRVRFMLAGNGALFDDIAKATATERLPVTQLGFVNLDLLPTVYAAADALLHASEADPHPLALSEAACMGLPLIVSDRVGAIGPTDIARAGENTIVVPCGSVASIVEAVRNLAEREELRRSMSETSLSIFRELDIHRSVAGLRQALDRCLVRAPAPRAEATTP